MNRRIFWSVGDGSGSGGDTGDSTPAGSGNTGRPTVQFTQAELDAKFVDAKRQGIRSLLRDLGFDTEDEMKAALGELTNLREKSASEIDKERLAYKKQVDDDAREKVRAAERRANENLIRAEVTVRATGRFLPKAMDDVQRHVLALAAGRGSSITVSDEGQVAGVQEALDALAQEKDYLLARSEPTQTIANGSPLLGRSGGTPPPAMDAEVARRAGIGISDRSKF